MDNKNQTREIVLILLQCLLAVAFGVMGFKVNEVSVAIYVAAAVAATSVAIVTVALVVISRLDRMEQVMQAQLGLRNLSTRAGKIAEFRRLRSSSDQVVLFCDSGLRQKLVEYGVYEDDLFESVTTLVDRREFHTGWKYLLPYKPQLAGIFFFRRESPDTPISSIFAPWGESSDETPWSVSANPRWCEMSYQSYQELKDQYGITKDQTIDSNWLLGKAWESLITFHKRWNEHQKHRIITNTPEWIYQEQNALSENAKWIHAFDMTEISEWDDSDFLGGCLLKNMESSKELKENGKNQIRRIIFAPSRRYLNEHPDYKAKLIKLIRLHLDGQVGCGLAFEEDVRRRKPDYIRDCVVYDRRVVWVETVPTTRFRGEGYFSTDPVEVSRFINMFDEVWQWRFAGKSPLDLAHELLDEQTQQSVTTVNAMTEDS